jgi:hypothetical protein
LNCPIVRCARFVEQRHVSHIAFPSFSPLFSFAEKKKPTLPLSKKKKIVLGEVHRNLVLDQLVKEQLVTCKYRKHGCNATIPLGNRKSHELHCQYGPSKCRQATRGCSFEGPKHRTLSFFFFSCTYSHTSHRNESGVGATFENMCLRVDASGKWKEKHFFFSFLLKTDFFQGFYSANGAPIPCHGQAN